ncbi:alkaline phosphatase [Leptolyngbya sp. NIES-2104]|uniref:alkaline phosphatase n=1 Tax=Leptolyngbya sp. NIES-2104 TaxID=1552121 RepID=UPI0009EB9C99|nr:alkaline phosphatase [Leptolyngbya sp. NIES-2104]
MAKNVILMIGDGMGWEMARAASIYQQIQQGNRGNTLDDFYTSGYGSSLNFQNLENKTLATTYGTTIADQRGTFSTGNSALLNNNELGATLFPSINSPTASNPLRPGFEFDPTFNPGTTATGGARINQGAVGNLVGYDPRRGGAVPWDAAYYGGELPVGFEREYIKYSYPDSANTATTLYTGVKSYNNAIAVDIYEQPLETLLVTAAQNNKSTGLVSSVPIDHATPGAAAATVNRRAKYDSEFPDIDSILQQELRIYQPTVLLGGGHPLSNTRDPLPDGVEPPNTFEFITDDTYQYLRDNPTANRYGYTFLERGENAAGTLADTATNLDPNAGDRLLGLYGARGQNGNLPVSTANGDYSRTGLDMFSVFTTQGLNPDTKRPLLPGETDFEFISREVNENPTLQQLSKAALDVLGKDEDGFWLMIEGGDIDWAAHDNNIDNLIGTVIDFDKAVGSVVEWINANGGWEENLLIVTADHDHYFTLNPNYPSLLQTISAKALTDIDDPAIAGNFWGSDPKVKYGWGNHSNRPVPVYYEGAGSEALSSFIGQGYESYGFEIAGLPGVVDQSQLYKTMLTAITGSTDRPLASGTIFGEEGDDLIYADVTDDTIFAEEGTNYIYANRGNNTVYSGAGNDLIYASFGDDSIYAGEGNNSVFAGAGRNTVFAGAGDDYISTGTGDDLIYAGDGANIIQSSLGNDTIISGSGNSVIDSGTGDDRVFVNGGNNRFVLNAGAGSVTIYGFTPDSVFNRGIGLSASGSNPAPGLSFSVNNGDTLVNLGDDLLATLKGVQLNELPIA